MAHLFEMSSRTFPSLLVGREATVPGKPVSKNNLDPDFVILEAWAQGFTVGSLVLLMLLVLCNYRRRAILHTLILLELFCAVSHGFYIFFHDPVHGWVLSGTVVPLFISYQIHNVVSWLKIRFFLPKWGAMLYIGSLILVQPYWVLLPIGVFNYVNNLQRYWGEIFLKIRPWESFLREPWWIFTTVKLVLVIKNNYDFTLVGLVRVSPRFGVMLFCMFLSVVFVMMDVIVTLAKLTQQSGINPYWRIALVFKCASDTIFMDDFKSVLDGIVEAALNRYVDHPYGSGLSGPVSGPKSLGNKTSMEIISQPQNTVCSRAVKISASPNGRDDIERERKIGWSIKLPSGYQRRGSLESRELNILSGDRILIEDDTTITVSKQNDQSSLNLLDDRNGSLVNSFSKPVKSLVHTPEHHSGGFLSKHTHSRRLNELGNPFNKSRSHRN